MHEVALAQAILDTVLDIADGQQPRAVRVRAGEILAVSPESLQFCFELVAQDTSAAQAQLDVDIVPGDALLIDAIELDDGWHYRPDVAQSVS
jgi:hydrogenase nickel incorporation protein HypA/HybF